MAASCTIVGISSGMVNNDLNLPPYEFLYQFWCQHRNCNCFYCQSKEQYYHPIHTSNPHDQYNTLVPPPAPSIHVKDNPKLFISNYPSLIAPELLNEQKKSKEKVKCILTCCNCQKEFIQKKWYKKHILQCNESKSCESCGKVFLTNKSLREHIRNIHSGNIFPCNQCDKSFKTRNGLKTHERRMHIPSELQKACNQCDKKFGCERSLQRHLENHDTDPSQWGCDLCGMFFQCAYNLKRHRLMQHVHKTLKCNDCKEYFDTIHDWWSHMEMHPKKKYACQECPLTFNNNKNLKRHSLVHTTQKSFHCELCDKSFKLKRSLEYHQLYRHYRLRSHTCTICRLSFARKCVLTEHYKKHYPKTLICPLRACLETFPTKYRLACHVATRHHSYFLQMRGLRATSTKNRNKMIQFSNSYTANRDRYYGESSRMYIVPHGYNGYT